MLPVQTEQQRRHARALGGGLLTRKNLAQLEQLKTAVCNVDLGPDFQNFLRKS